MKTIIRNFLSVLRRFKMATILNVLGLSIAFAAFMVIMMQVDYDTTFNKSHTNADAIYRVELEWENEAPQAIFSRPLAEAFIRFSPHIVSGAITRPFNNQTPFMVDRNGTRESYLESNMAVAPSFVDVFHFDMLEGSAAALKEPDKLLISESISRKIFGEESAVGKLLFTKESQSMISGLFEDEEISYTVGGVYKDFPKNSSVGNTIYMAMDEKENLDHWGNMSYNLYVRLDSPESADGLIADFMTYYKANNLGKNMEWFTSPIHFRLSPFTDLHFITDVTYDWIPKSSQQTLWVLIAIAMAILLIAGINFTNFSTALTPMRIKSINTQKVLGSPDGVLRLALLLEAVAVSFVAYLLALLLVFWAADSSIIGLIEADITLTAHPVLLVVMAILAIVVGGLAGVYPSYYITSFPPALVLKGSFGLSPKGRKLRNVLISAQFVASFVLIIGALFMYLQNDYMQNSPLGYDKDELITTNLTKAMAEKKEVFSNQLKGFSGIEGVTYSDVLLSSQEQYMSWGRDLRGKNIQFQCIPVDPSFLQIMGISVNDGRDFREDDKLTANGTLIFNEQARLTYNLQLGDKLSDLEVVGFMPDVKFMTFRQAVTPMAFYVWGKERWSNGAGFAYIKVKAGSDLRVAMQHVKETLKEMEPDYPFDIRFYDEVLHKAYEKEENLSILITLFSLIAVFISIVGVFGLVVFDSEYRKKEISLRKVLGSTTVQILVMFNKIYIRILLLCFVLAAPVAWYAVDRWLENFAYKTPIYWWVFVLAFIIIATITILTVTFQNWRAANENPVNSIKSE